MPYSFDKYPALPTMSEAAPLLGAAALIAGASLVRSPLRLALAIAGGALLGREVAAMLSARRYREVSEPEYVSDYTPGPDGRLSDDDLVLMGSEDSFPASDPPSYTGTRSGKPAHAR